MISKDYADKTLDALIDLDKQTTAAYYDMGRLLVAIKDSKLYDLSGYDHFQDLVEEELSFTYTTANGYMRAFRNFQRLGYHRTEAINMITQFGLIHMTKILRDETHKIGVRAIKNRIAELDDNQMTFWMNDKQLAEVSRALRAMGAEFDSETHRWSGSSDALLDMAKEINAKPKVKKVA